MEGGNGWRFSESEGGKGAGLERESKEGNRGRACVSVGRKGRWGL